MQQRLDSIIRIFLYVLVFWIPYSPAVVEVCVVCSLILWIFKRTISIPYDELKDHSLKENSLIFLNAFRPRASPLNSMIGFFIIACLLSVVGSLFFVFSLHNFMTKTLEWFIVYFLVIEVFTSKKHLLICFGIFFFTSFSTAVDSILQFYITHRDIFSGHVIEPGQRPTASFKTPNGLGGYLSIVIPMVMAAVLLSKSISKRVIMVVLCAVALWSLVISSSRGALLGVTVGIVFFFCAYQTSVKKKNLSGIWIGVLTAALFLSLFSVMQFGNIELFLEERMNSVYWRLEIWKDSFTMIVERPIFGHGINTFMTIFQEYNTGGGARHAPTYAHNCFLQLAAETGIIGIMCFLGIIWKLFVTTLQRVSDNPSNDNHIQIAMLGLLSGILAFLVHSFFDTNFYSLQLSVHFWYMVGVLFSMNNLFDKSGVYVIKKG